MKKIKSPWIGKKEYYCFGCCPDNKDGIRMQFYADGDEVVSVWKPQRQFQGWVDTLHGGIQAVMLDEICAWAVMLKMNTTGVTAKMETRYKHSIMTTDRYVVLRAKVIDVRRNIATIEASISDSMGTVCAQATCTYFTFSKEKSTELEMHDLEIDDEDITLEQLIASIA